MNKRNEERVKKRRLKELNDPNTHPLRSRFLQETMKKYGWWKAIFECVADSPKLGKKGQRESIGNIHAETKEEAEQKAKTYCPQNWIVLEIIQQGHEHDGNCGCS